VTPKPSSWWSSGSRDYQASHDPALRERIILAGPDREAKLARIDDVTNQFPQRVSPSTSSALW
jgi:hypothetical protein